MTWLGTLRRSDVVGLEQQLKLFTALGAAGMPLALVPQFGEPVSDTWLKINFFHGLLKWLVQHLRAVHTQHAAGSAIEHDLVVHLEHPVVEIDLDHLAVNR